MKKLKAIIPIVAFVIAISSAFATKLSSTLPVDQFTAFQLEKGVMNPTCDAITCDDAGTIDCVNYNDFDTYLTKTGGGQCQNLDNTLKRVE